MIEFPACIGLPTTTSGSLMESAHWSLLVLLASYCVGSGVPLNLLPIWCNLAKKKQIAGPN